MPVNKVTRAEVSDSGAGVELLLPGKGQRRGQAD